MKKLFLLVFLNFLLVTVGYTQLADTATDLPSLILTLQEVEDLALQNNQTIQAQVYRLRQSYYAYQESKGNLLPQLSLSADVGVRKENHCSSGYLLSLRQVLYHPAYYYSTKEANLRYEMTKLELEKEIIQTLFQVRQAYYQALLAQKQVYIEQSAISFFKMGLEKYEHQVSIGLSTASELNRMKLALIRAKASLNEAQKKRQDHLYNLLTLLSLSPNTDIQLPDQEIPLPPFVQEESEMIKEMAELSIDLFCSPSLIEQWESLARQYNPDLKRAEVNLTLTELEIKKRRADYYPTVSVFVNGGHLCQRQESFCCNANWNTGIQLNWNLFDGWKTSNQVLQAKEASQAIEQQTNQLELTIQIDIRRLIMDLGKAYQNYLIAKQAELIAQEGLALVEQQQQLNLLSVLEYREAIQAWQLTQQEINQAKNNLLLIYYQLIKYAGLDLHPQ